MAIEILMPALSPTMTEGTLAKWHVAVGDTVESGQVIAEIETDKATMEVEAVDEGTIGKIVVAEGTENVAVNAQIAILLEEDPSAMDGMGHTMGNTTGDVDAPVEKASVHAMPAVANAPIATPATAEPEWNGAWKQQTVREALRDAMAEEMRAEDTVFLMGEEVAEYQGAYKVSQGLLDEFGHRRVIDTPITEIGFTGLACGAAFKGLRPIVEYMTFNFAMQALDHIVNSAAKTLYMSGGQLGCPIVFRGANGAAARVGAQHSQCYAAWFGHIPGLKVVAPYNAADAKGLLKSAIRDNNPVIFLENELLYGETFDVPDTDDWTVPIGKARIARAGTDVTLVAYGIMVGRAEKAAEQLAEQGISAEVIDLRTIRPMDTATVIASVQKTNRIVTCEEGWAQHGIGAEISAVVTEQAFDYLDAPVVRVSAKDVPLPYAANLEKLALPQVDDIVQSAKSVCYK